jgi:hypothetical protein
VQITPEQEETKASKNRSTGQTGQRIIGIAKTTAGGLHPTYRLVIDDSLRFLRYLLFLTGTDRRSSPRISELVLPRANHLGTERKEGNEEPGPRPEPQPDKIVRTTADGPRPTGRLRIRDSVRGAVPTL